MRDQSVGIVRFSLGRSWPGWEKDMIFEQLAKIRDDSENLPSKD